MSDSKHRAGIRTGDADAASIIGDPERSALRDAFSFWATGVSVITVRDQTGIHGLTASAFTPLSVDPPLVLVCVGNDAPILTHLLDAGRFTVNVLSSKQKRAANSFSDRYAVALPAFREGDDAVIDDALASMVCVLDRNLDGGDHRIITGRVVRADAATDGAPLLHYRRGYRMLD
jgi:flavin reductase (NADH)